MSDNICFECGCVLEMLGGKDRVFSYDKGKNYIIPDDFLMPTCCGCGTEFVTPEVEREIYKLIEGLT